MTGRRMLRALAFVLMIALCGLPTVAGPDYRTLYEQALTLYEQALADAASWQDQAFALSAEIGRQKDLVEEALKLHTEAEADVSRLAAEVERLAKALDERDAIIEMQAAQLRKLLGTERYTWLLAGLLAGVVGGYMVGSPGK